MVNVTFRFFLFFINQLPDCSQSWKDFDQHTQMYSSTNARQEPGPEAPWFFFRGLQQVSFCDWPGRISCVIFLGGCNLACPTCHNWQLAQHFQKLPCISREFLFSYLYARQDWLDGIVISGGEPTCCPGIESLLQQLQATGLPLKLDTNGLRPKQIKFWLQSELVPLLAVDIKGPWEKYPLLSGNKCSPMQARSALENIFELAKEHPDHFLFRCTRVPDLDSADLRQTRDYLPQGFKLHLQQYVPPGK